MLVWLILATPIATALLLVASLRVVRANPDEILLVSSTHRRLATRALTITRFVTCERVRTAPFELVVVLQGVQAPRTKDGHPIDIRATFALRCRPELGNVVEAARNFGAAGVGDPAVVSRVMTPLYESAVVETVASYTEQALRTQPAEISEHLHKITGMAAFGHDLDHCELTAGIQLTEAMAEGPFR